jgi:hypothetical protein
MFHSPDSARGRESFKIPLLYFFHNLINTVMRRFSALLNRNHALNQAVIPLTAPTAVPAKLMSAINTV